MWLISVFLSNKIIKFFTPKLNLTTNTQKEIKWLVSSIVTALTALFALLYFLLSHSLVHCLSLMG